MVDIRLGPILRDVRHAGATKRKVIRAKDTTIRTLKCGYIYLDVVKQSGEYVNFDPTTRRGNELLAGNPFLWTDDTLVVADDAAFNNQPVIQGTGAQHYLRIEDSVRRSVPNLESFDIIVCLSMPQAVLDLADAFTLGNRYVVSIYDNIANAFLGGIQFFATGASKGWSLNPKLSVNGNGFNILMTTYPAVRPVADVPFIIRWRYEQADKTSRFYFNDLATPIASNVHAIGDAGGANGRYWPMSFGPGSNNAGWQGKMASFFVADRSDGSTKMTEAQAAAIGSEWAAAFDI